MNDFVKIKKELVESFINICKESEEVSAEESVYNIVNLTPHKIDIYDASGTNLIKTLEPQQPLIRVKTETTFVKSVKIDETNSVNLFTQKIGGLTELPEPKENTFYLVSAIAFAKAKEIGRKDCLMGNEYIRDAGNNIIGIKSFCISE